MPNYWNLYLEIKEFYFGLKKLPCEALGGQHIVFDDYGFTHIVRKGNRKRSIPDQIRRFKLLRDIKRYIETCSLRHSDAMYHILHASEDTQNVKIVIGIRRKDRVLFFISIMDE